MKEEKEIEDIWYILLRYLNEKGLVRLIFSRANFYTFKLYKRILPAQSKGTKIKTSNINCFCFHDNKLALGSDTLAIWDIITEEIIFEVGGFRRYRENFPVFEHLQFSNNGKLIAAGMNSGTIKIWDIVENRLVETIERGYVDEIEHHTDQICYFKFSECDRYLFSSDIGAWEIAILWDISSSPAKKLHQHIWHNPSCQNISFSKNSEYVIIPRLCDERCVNVYSLDTTSREKTKIYVGFGVFDIDISKCGRYVIYTGIRYNRASRYIDLYLQCLEGDILWKITEKTEHIKGTAIHSNSKFSPCGRYIAYGHRHQIRIYEFEDRNVRLLRTIYTGKTHTIFSIIFTPCGFITSGSQENEFRMWDIHTGRIVHTSSGYSLMVNEIFAPSGLIRSSKRDERTSVSSDLFVFSHKGRWSYKDPEIKSINIYKKTLIEFPIQKAGEKHHNLHT